MRKVFQIMDRLFWANGKSIRGAQGVGDLMVGDLFSMQPIGKKLITVEIVKPPPGRCPCCGEKVELTR